MGDRMYHSGYASCGVRCLFAGFHFAFPCDQHGPAEGLGLGYHPLVSTDITREFILPEIYVGFRGVGNFAACMPMPEATMHEDDRPVTRQYDVRLARQFLISKPEPEPKRVQRLAQQHFGFGVS